MSGMSTIQKACFICAWVIAGGSFLAIILYGAGAGDLNYPASAVFGRICIYIFIGLTGCFSLLNLSGWFKSNLTLFILGWVVAGLAAIGTLCELVANADRSTGILTTANLFGDLVLGTFCTILLIHLSGKFGRG